MPLSLNILLAWLFTSVIVSVSVYITISGCSKEAKKLEFTLFIYFTSSSLNAKLALLYIQGDDSTDVIAFVFFSISSIFLCQINEKQYIII